MGKGEEREVWKPSHDGTGLKNRPVELILKLVSAWPNVHKQLSEAAGRLILT